MKKLSITKIFLFSARVLVTMIDGSLVLPVSFDIIRKCIDGLCTVIFTERVIFCFTWLTCVFGGLNIFIVLY
jgi:hypothetical protein